MYIDIVLAELRYTNKQYQPENGTSYMRSNTHNGTERVFVCVFHKMFTETYSRMEMNARTRGLNVAYVVWCESWLQSNPHSKIGEKKRDSWNEWKLARVHISIIKMQLKDTNTRVARALYSTVFVYPIYRWRNACARKTTGGRWQRERHGKNLRDTKRFELHNSSVQSLYHSKMCECATNGRLFGLFIEWRSYKIRALVLVRQQCEWWWQWVATGLLRLPHIDSHLVNNFNRLCLVIPR